MASDRERRSILATIMGVESGGRNIPQGIVDINTAKGTPAQGYFQIIDPTWAAYGGNRTDFKSAINAPYELQRQVALNIPVDQWGPATQAALRTAGYEPKPGETLGQLLQRHGEDPNATSPSDAGTGVGGGSGSGSGTTTAAAGGDNTILSGLLARQQAADQAAQAAAARAAQTEQDKQQAGYKDAVKQGLGLLSQGETPAPAMNVAPARTVQPGQPVGMPDFREMLAQQRLQRRLTGGSF